MDELQKQVQTLAQTVTTMIARLDQAMKMFDEILASSRDLVTKQQEAINNFQVVTRALESSLGDLENGIDDQAKITAALLQIQQEAEASA